MRRTLIAALSTLAAGLALAGDRIPAKGGDIEITPLVHASVQIEFGGKVIQVDPWSLADLSQAKPADLILISDDVGHHLDPKAIEKLRKAGAPVVMPESGKVKVADGIVLANGATTTAAGLKIESIAAYDLKPGAPEHPKGEANGYVITLGGKRVFFAGVTECVPEIKALKGIDIAFMPMNIPPERMSPADTAACVKAFKPSIVYLYHYDQNFASDAAKTPRYAKWLPEGMTVPQSLDAFKEALKGTSIDVRAGDWYPSAQQTPAAPPAPSASPAASRPARPPVPPATGDMLDIANRLADAINKQDAAGIQKMVADDAVYLDEDGHAPAPSRWIGFLTTTPAGAPPKQIEISNTHSQTWDNTGWVSFNYAIAETINGEPKSVRGTASLTLRKNAAGEWKIQMIHGALYQKVAGLPPEAK